MKTSIKITMKRQNAGAQSVVLFTADYIGSVCNALSKPSKENRRSKNNCILEYFNVYWIIVLNQSIKYIKLNAELFYVMHIFWQTFDETYLSDISDAGSTY